MYYYKRLKNEFLDIIDENATDYVNKTTDKLKKLMISRIVQKVKIKAWYTRFSY